MEKQKNVVFGTALNGYKKQDVNAFITTLNANFSAVEAGYRKEITALKEEVAQLREKENSYSTREAELTALHAELAEVRTQLLEAEEKLLNPSATMGSEEEAELRKKAALYDCMSSQLGDLMISANHDADQLLEEARSDAEQSLGAAKATIARSATLLSGQLEEIYRSANTRAMGEISTTIRQTQRALTKFLDDLSARRARLEEVLHQTDAETRRTAEEQIVKMLDQTKTAIAAIGAKDTTPDSGVPKA